MKVEWEVKILKETISQPILCAFILLGFFISSS